MRVGSTRRWRRGQMQRARDRDQRLEAGMRGIALEACLCMEVPLVMRIARGQNAETSMAPSRGDCEMEEASGHDWSYDEMNSMVDKAIHAGPKASHTGHDRAGLCQRVFLLGIDLYGYPHWRGGDAGAAAGRDALSHCGRDSAGLVPLARLAPAMAAAKSCSCSD